MMAVPTAYGGPSWVKPIHSCADALRALAHRLTDPIPQPFLALRSASPPAGDSGPRNGNHAQAAGIDPPW